MSLAPSRICLACKHRDKSCMRGACACDADPQKRDIAQMQYIGCPLGKFEPIAPAPTFDPRRVARIHPPKLQPDIPLAGDVVAAIAQKIGADRLARLWEKWTGQPCGCNERRQKLNAASARLFKWLARRPAEGP